MKIAFGTIYNSLDVNRGSGTYYHMSQELERQGHTILRLGPLEYQYPMISRLLRVIQRKLKYRYITFLDPFVARQTGKQVTKKLSNLNYDVLLTNDYAIAGYTETSKPVILYTDAMLTHNYIERNLASTPLMGLSPVGLWLSRQTIRRGLRHADLCIFPTEWAANEANYYCSDQDKLTVIPFGANLENIAEEVYKTRSLPTDGNPLNILLVGRDWFHKGGTIVFQTVKQLRELGINAHLHVAGCDPEEIRNTEFATAYGMLNKTVEADRSKLHSLFEQAHIFMMPSFSEGFGIVFLEAAAYGIPSLAYATTGVTTSVQHGKSGFLFELGSGPEPFVNTILEWINNPEAYHELVEGARSFYEEYGNWPTAITHLVTTIESTLN